MNIHMVTVIGNHLGVHLGVFDRMLRHYKNLGLDSLLINVQPDEYDDGFHAEVRSIASRYNAHIVSVFVGQWTESVNTFLYRHTMEQCPSDWFVLADTDEFQVYPGSLQSILESANNEKFDYIEGFVIDRVSIDGAFPELKKDQPLWEQFPLAGLVTFPLLGANIQKVVAAKGSTQTSAGQHYAHNGKGYPTSQIYIPVHHFKWTAGLSVRLKERVRFLKSIGSGLWHENNRLVEYCESNALRLDVSDPIFMLQESGTVCPHAEALQKVVLANAHRMPRPSA